MPSNNIISDYISDYEKIIFVNNINETSSVDLIKNYGFAVFFTKNENLPDNWPASWGNHIKNIWYGGQRLNRFIGIDPNNSTLNVGNHIVKLFFDYEKGYLSIVDTNKLESISFVELSYTDAYTGAISNNTVINSIDNTFILKIKFTADENDENYDVTKISELIDIQCESNKLNMQYLQYEGEAERDQNNKPPLWSTRSYLFKILYDTEIPLNADKNRVYTIISKYDTDKTSDPLNLVLRLNPTSIDVRNRTSNTSITNKTFNDLTTNVTDVYDVFIYPNNGEAFSQPLSNNNRKLYIKVESSNINAVTVNGNNKEVYIEVGSTNNFELTIKPAPVNENISSNITVSVVWGNEHNNFYNNNLKYSFKINVNSTVIGMYYVGYEDPTSESFDTNLLQSLSDIDVLYDWETTTLVEDLTKHFYVVIPATEVNNIFPRWDGYTINGNTKTYNYFGNNSNIGVWDTRFIRLSDKNLKNINCAIFKSFDTYKGKFYGKIQKN